MENLLRLLPTKGYSRVTRYGITAVIVLVFFLTRIALHFVDSPFLLFIPAVFLASVIFDRGSGFVAMGLSAILSIYFLPPEGSFTVSLDELSSIAVFVLICIGIAVLSEALCQALDQAVEAEQKKDLLLRELAHRTQNNLQVITSILLLQARAQTDPAARLSFDQAIARVRTIASAYGQLTSEAHGAVVNMRQYLTDLCRTLGDSLRGMRPVAVRPDIEDLSLPTAKAITVGLIANELVTNAFKYAFPEGSAGAIDVVLRRADDNAAVLEVRDNGVGYTPDAQEGSGTRLVRLLVQQLGGTFVREALNPGCRALCRFEIADVSAAGSAE